MNITITFRHLDSSDAIKLYATEKVGRLQKFLRHPMTARVTLSLDKLNHTVEVRVSAGGEHLEAKDTSEDLYASIDKVIDKLERQVRAKKGAVVARTRRATVREVPPALPVASPAGAAKKKAVAKAKPAKAAPAKAAPAKAKAKAKAPGRARG